MATELSLISENRPPSASVGRAITSARTPPQSISAPARKTSVLAPSSRTPRKKVLYVRVLFGSPDVDRLHRESVEHVEEAADVVRVRVANHDAVEGVDAPAAQEVHDVRPLLRSSRIDEITLATGLH